MCHVQHDVIVLNVFPLFYEWLHIIWNIFQFVNCIFMCAHLHTGANPLQTNVLGHTARTYAKEGEVGTILQEWEGKV